MNTESNDTLSAFRTAYESLQAARAERQTLYDLDSERKHTHPEARALMAAQAADFLALWRSKYGNRKKYNEPRMGKEYPAEVKALQDKYQPLMRELVNRFDAPVETAEAACVAAAESAPIPASTEWVFYHRSYGSCYASQGFGQLKYTRQAAENAADLARFYNIPVEVREVNRHSYKSCNWTMETADYEVWVKTTELGAEVLRRKPGPGLRDWLKACWKRGVNPRVYDPFLPHGLEERLGLDYFGGETASVNP